MSLDQLGIFAEGFNTYRRAMAAANGDMKLGIFANACAEVASYVAKGLDRTVAADELNDMAVGNGLMDDPDAVQAIMAKAFANIEEADRVPDDIPETERQHKNGKHKRPKILLLSKKDFVSGFIPPKYLIHGVLQRRFIYALTGQTGHAKTAIALLLAELVSRADMNFSMLGTHRVEQGRVIYFVGENADDIRMRVIGADSKRDGDPMLDRITFIPGQFHIGEMFGLIAQHADKLGGVDLVVVDTSAAYFLGQDEVSNVQMRAHASMLRKLTELPGGPCVLVLCHPVKYVTEASQLLPRGGGAFLGEIDGNLTAWKHSDTLVELSHGKMRGPGFEAISFKLERITTPSLVDGDGRELPTIRAVPITQSDEDQQQTKAREDEDRVLSIRLKVPDAEALSIAEIALRAGWTWGDGSPAKSRVQKILERLEKAKPALVYRDRGVWMLTEKGKDAARKAALRILATEEAEHNQSRLDLH